MCGEKPTTIDADAWEPLRAALTTPMIGSMLASYVANAIAFDTALVQLALVTGDDRDALRAYVLDRAERWTLSPVETAEQMLSTYELAPVTSDALSDPASVDRAYLKRRFEQRHKRTQP